MLQKTKGIVLRKIKYTEDSQIVSVYTEKDGMMSFMLRQSHARKNSLQAVLVSPLSILELMYDYKPSQKLQRVREISLAYPYSSISCHPVKVMMAMYLQEFLYHSLKSEQTNLPLFAYLEHGLKWLDCCQQDFANFHLVFLMRLTRFLGIWPNMDDFQTGAVFDMVDGQFVSGIPVHRTYLDIDESAILPVYMRMNMRTMHLFKMNRVQRFRFLEILNEYYRLHVPEFPELKSADILRDVLS